MQEKPVSLVQLQRFCVCLHETFVLDLVWLRTLAKHKVSSSANMIEFKDLPPNRITDLLDRAFHLKNSFCTTGNDCVLPQRYREISEQVKTFKVRSDDVYLCSYPRTGSTWLSEILWLLSNNLDYEKAHSIVQQVRSPTLELTSLFAEDKNKSDWMDQLMGSTNSIDFIDRMQGRRLIKTHLPWHMLPEQMKTNADIKIVYTMRNPKDQAVSYYHYCLLAHQINCSFDEFIEVFLANKMVYGSSSQHMIDFYKRRHQSNILLVKYEDMKRDLPSVIRLCADHLEINRTLTTDDIDKLCDYVKFEKMEKNSSVNLETIVFQDPVVQEQIDHETYNKVKFIRKGQIGDWQNYFSPETNRKFDKWIEENLASTGLTFDYV